MKNYYEILEVDKNASQEVIDKAYRTLVKKYHPDLQENAQQKENEEKMKIINEAYSVLSDEFKRKDYDVKLQSETISKEQIERTIQENYALKQELNRIRNYQSKDEGTIGNISRVINEQINMAKKQAYEDAYIQDMKNRGYKIKYKHDLKYYLKLVIILLIIAFACFLIYQIPFVKTFFNNLYEENIIFQSIVDIIVNTFTTKF